MVGKEIPAGGKTTGVGVGVVVTPGLGVAVGPGVPVGVGVAVGPGVGVEVGPGVGVAVGPGVGVPVATLNVKTQGSAETGVGVGMISTAFGTEAGAVGATGSLPA